MTREQGQRRGWLGYAVSTAAVVATAVSGSVAVDPNSHWYRRLRKPPWQPPAPAFGLVWTPLYATIAWSAGRVLNRVSPGERSAYATSLGTNLTLNAGWNWLFFKAHKPAAGLVGLAALNASNLQLIERTARTDGKAAALLVPYALWCGFATALNADIWRRNR